MDFGIYPPEINSGRMYAGPGSGPMLAAAQAWGSLADELYTAASAYQSVVSELTSGSWSGPSSTSMTTAAGTYVEWLSATAAQAEETAAQGRAAAAGYEAAFAMTVPPPEIAANRSLLAVLVATNFLGMNTPAIAATEAQYAEMWAQDAVAMYGYAGSSAAATVLSPFTSPDQNTDPGGTASQAAAVSQASGSAAGNAQGTISAVPQALSAAAAPAQTDPLTTLANLISVFLSAPSDLVTLFLLIPMDALSGPVDLPIAYLGTIGGLRTDNTISGWEGTEGWPGTEDVPPERFQAPYHQPGCVRRIGAVGEPGPGQHDRRTVGAVELDRRRARDTLGRTDFPAYQPHRGAAPAVEAGSANTFNQMGIGGMAGQAMAGPPAAGNTQESGKPVTHARLTPRVTGAASDGEPEATPAPRTVVTGVAAAIRDIAKQRAQGNLTEQEYKEQKKRLLEVSIGHRPLA